MQKQNTNPLILSRRQKSRTGVNHHTKTTKLSNVFIEKSSQFSDLPSKYQAIQGDHGESEETKKRAKSMKRVNRQPHTNTHTQTHE